MANIRVFPGKANVSPITVNGTTYTPAQGTATDAPDFTAQVLEANGYVLSFVVGTTAQRPTTPAPGDKYIDTSLSSGTVIVFDGTLWRNAVSGASV